MKRISYKKGNLFDVKSPSLILVHACNCRGVWGSGIAVEFKNRYPDSYKDYKGLCDRWGDALLGNGLFYSNLEDPKNIYRIGYLFTSRGYGVEKDSEKKILRSTDFAVRHILSVLKDEAEVHSPKINSGRFGVPWEKTEAIIEAHLKPRKIKWTVWEL